MYALRKTDTTAHVHVRGIVMCTCPRCLFMFLQ